MNRKEYLLTCLAEECSELAIECSKSKRFGLDSYGENDTATLRYTNSENLVKEFVDVYTIIKMLDQVEIVLKIEKELKLAQELTKSLTEISTTLSYTRIQDKDSIFETLKIIGPSQSAHQKNISLISELLKELENF